MSKYLVTVVRDGTEKNIYVTKGESLMEALTLNGVYMSAPCGGAGLCGKCKVQMLEGATEISSEDENVLSKEELDEGYRLSCRSFPESDCRIRLVNAEEDSFDVVSEYKGNEQSADSEMKENSYDIAIDIGTTTIAVGLVGGDSRTLLHVVTAVNRQRAYGADVVSRIQASIDGKKEVLKECIRKDLQSAVAKLLDEKHIELTKINKIVIAANTTMGHLLMGFPCDTLGVAPFTPVDIGTIRTSFSKLFCVDGVVDKNIDKDINTVINMGIDIEVVLLPGISTYVGADITSGLMACDFDKSDEVIAFVDLGTNGEMAIGNKDRILVTSTAAGPAFEGGNISCGMGSVAGAVCHVDIRNGETICDTIGNAPMIGICGTGVIECTYELLKEGLIDETGMLDETYFDEGFELGKTPEGQPVVYTQSDIREIQLAKSAVRAGFETLITRYGVSYNQIDKVYLAGGFGYKMDIEKAVGIGLFPAELKDRIIPVGNSSLKGAVRYLTEADSVDRTSYIVEHAEEISLAMDDDFNQLYMDYMYFGDVPFVTHSAYFHIFDR